MRKTPLFLLAGLLWGGCQGLKLDRIPSTVAADWVTDGGGSARLQATTEAIEPPLELLWSANTGGAFGQSSPLIFNNYVLLGTRKGDLVGYALDTGKKVGTEELAHAIDGGMVYYDGKVFVPASWGEKVLYAYALRSGKTVWKVEKQAPITAGLLLLDGAVVAGDMGGFVTAYQPSNGTVLWETLLEERAEVRGSPVADAGGTVYAATSNGRVVALDAKDGTVRWQVDLETPVYVTMALQDNVLLVPTTRGKMYALDAATGRSKWVVRLDDETVRFTAPAVDNGQVILGATDGFLRALSLETGAELWSFEHDKAFAGSPLLTEQTVYTGNMGYDFLALDRETGQLKWSYTLKGRVKSAMAAKDGHIVVLSEPRQVYVFKQAEETYAQQD